MRAMPRSIWTLLGVSPEAEISIARGRAEKWARKGGVAVTPTLREEAALPALPEDPAPSSAPPASQLDHLADLVAARLGLQAGASSPSAPTSRPGESALDVETEARLLPSVNLIPHTRRPTVSYRPPKSYRRAIDWIAEVTGQPANTVHADALRAGLSARLADLQAAGHAIPEEWIEGGEGGSEG